MKFQLTSSRACSQSAWLEAGLLLFTGIILAGCMRTPPGLRASEDQACVTVNRLESPGAAVASNRKVIVVNFLFSDGKVEPQDPVVTFGRGQTPVSQGCNFSFLMLGTQDEVLAQFGIWDPRTQISDERPQKGFVVAKHATYAARFPFSTQVKEIRLLDSRREQVSVVDLTSAVRVFCREHPKDSDCKDLVK